MSIGSWFDREKSDLFQVAMGLFDFTTVVQGETVNKSFGAIGKMCRGKSFILLFSNTHFLKFSWRVKSRGKMSAVYPVSI